MPPPHSANNAPAHSAQTENDSDLCDRMAADVRALIAANLSNP